MATLMATLDVLRMHTRVNDVRNPPVLPEDFYVGPSGLEPLTSCVSSSRRGVRRCFRVSDSVHKYWVYLRFWVTFDPLSASTWGAAPDLFRSMSAT